VELLFIFTDKLIIMENKQSHDKNKFIN